MYWFGQGGGSFGKEPEDNRGLASFVGEKGIETCRSQLIEYVNAYAEFTRLPKELQSGLIMSPVLEYTG